MTTNKQEEPKVMKRLIWNLQLAALLVKHAWMPWLQAWKLARSSDDSYNNDETPQDAYDIELSYWGDS